jgi:hypothetical protein
VIRHGFAQPTPGTVVRIEYTNVDVPGATLSNLDAFIQARYAVVANGGEIASWLVRPAVAEAVSKLKVASGSNQNLVQFVNNWMLIAGVPVLISDQARINSRVPLA